MGDEISKKIAHELAENLRASISVDWRVRESVRPKMRNLVRRLIKKYKYSPDQQEEAIDLVQRQTVAFPLDYSPDFTAH